MTEHRWNGPFAHLYDTGGLRCLHLRDHARRLSAAVAAPVILIRPLWQTVSSVGRVALFTTRPSLEHEMRHRGIAVRDMGFATGCSATS
jgi:hypothetical protein